jgi:hypothetical protein
VLALQQCAAGDCGKRAVKVLRRAEELALDLLQYKPPGDDGA